MLNKKLRLVCGLAATAAVALASSAQAGWGSYGSYGSMGGSGGGSGGSWGSYGGGYSSHGGWGGSHGSHGGRHHGGLFHHHRRSWGSHGSHGGSWGSSGGSSGYTSGYGSSGGYGHGSSGGYGSSGGHGSSGGTYYSPVVPGTMVPGEVAPGAEVPAAPLPDANKAATLKVAVPEDALVYVNGVLTKSTGADRTYVSRGLQPGFQYTYEVRAEAIREGKKVEETKIVNLKAGDSQDLAFSSLQPAKSSETTLTLNVPAEAKVSLGGNPTIGSGAVRTFSTSKLDKEWSNYLIQVSVERDGRTVSQEKTITLKAGDSQTLTFDFDRDQIAAR